MPSLLALPVPGVKLQEQARPASSSHGCEQQTNVEPFVISQWVMDIGAGRRPSSCARSVPSTALPASSYRADFSSESESGSGEGGWSSGDFECHSSSGSGVELEVTEERSWKVSKFQGLSPWVKTSEQLHREWFCCCRRGHWKREADYEPNCWPCCQHPEGFYNSIFRTDSTTGSWSSSWAAWLFERDRRCLFATVVLGCHAVIQTWVWYIVFQQKTIWDWPSWIFGCAALVTTSLPLIFWLVFEFFRGESSAAAQQAAWIFWLHWVSQNIMNIAKATEVELLWEVGELTKLLMFIMTALAVWWRVSMAEAGLKLRGCSRFSKAIAIFGLIQLGVVLFRALQIAFANTEKARFFVPLLDNSYKTIAYIIIGFLCWCRFTKMLQMLTTNLNLLRDKKYLISEARWAHDRLWQIRFGLILLTLIGAVASSIRIVLATQSERRGHWTATWVYLFDLPTNLYLPSDFVSLLLTVGCFRIQRPGALLQSEESENLDHSKTQEIAEAWAGTRSEDWQQTVHTLATRYIEVGELLDFYDRLPQLMKHFDGKLHTTNDVVRAVIVPGSQLIQAMPQRQQFQQKPEQSSPTTSTSHLSPSSRTPIHSPTRANATIVGKAFADRLAEGRSQRHNSGSSRYKAEEPTHIYAQRLVTHDWRNLFSHLVAVVVADALGKDEYAPIARKLLSGSRGVRELQWQLEQSGKACIRYWICAFCVNQHTGICNSLASTSADPHSPESLRAKANVVDTVTGAPHQPCSCQQPKHSDGDLCEMNKFDDLMELLHQKVPELCQVVAIDRNFDLFSRVWCVAELVEAHRAKIRQNVCLLSKSALDANTGDLGLYLKLATISVANCRASRSEDRDRIVSRIEALWGIPEFDAQLQATIFGPRGLLGKELLGFDVIYAAARVALRVQVMGETLSLASA